MSANPATPSAPQPLPYKLEPDDKVTPVMAYTLTGMARGEMVSKEAIRVGTWLRSVAGIPYFSLYRAQTMTSTGSGTPQVAAFTELHIPINQVVAYHILPPATEPLDYDPSEMHRRWEAMVISFGPFRAVGKMRLGENTSLATHLKTSRETYMSFYEVEVSMPSVPNMNAIKTPFLMLQPGLVTFAIKA